MTKHLSLSLSELEHYAQMLNTSVLQDANDPTFILDEMMLGWCKQHDSTVVLKNGNILTSNPVGPELHTCQQYMSLHNIEFNEIFLTTEAVINYLKNKFISRSIDSLSVISDSHLQLRALIYSGVKSGASDIHLLIMPTAEQTIVKFRINGYLETYAKWTDQVGIKIHSVAYNHLSSNKQDAFSMVLPQDMSFTEEFDNTMSVRIRSSNIGIKNGGCKVVYRLLSIGNEQTPDLPSLGYLHSQIKLLDKIRYLSSGLVLFCGETGSGKTTSLASVLSSVDQKLSVYSVEDPVEKYIDNVVQCPVDTRNEKRNFAFYLRALLRNDPDVIMVGEIRDSETAEVAIQGALTGHLILSTLHTKHAVNAVMRLHDLGIPASHLATPGLLRVLVAQRLYPILCEKCSRYLTQDEKTELLHHYNEAQMNELKTAKKDPTCTQCHGSGIKGRRVFAELINVDRKGREYISRMDIHGWQEYLYTQGFVSMDERVKTAILNGEVDVLSLKALEPTEYEEYIYES